MLAPQRPAVDFGVAGSGVAIGEAYDVQQEAARLGVGNARVAQLGYRTLRRARDEATATVLGAEAARLACEEAGISVNDVQLVVLAAGATVPDYLNWDPSTDLTRALGITSVPTLLLTQGCASGVLGFEQVAGLLAVRSDLDTVLLVAADRVSERHVRRIGATADSDGAAALVLRRQHPALRWLSTAQLTDSTYADFFRLEFCGRAAPCGGDASRNVRMPPALRAYEYFSDDPDGFSAWAGEVDARVVDVITMACAQAGVDPAEVTRLLLLNDSQPSIASIAAAARIDLSHTNAELAAGLGHFGGADPLVSLSVLNSAGEIDPGELVAMAGMSSGMHWFCTLIRA